jgi:hypothetical protein
MLKVVCSLFHWQYQMCKFFCSYTFGIGGSPATKQTYTFDIANQTATK